MAGVKISALPTVASALITDIFPAVQGGVTSQETLLQVRTLFGFNSGTGLLAMASGGTNANLTAANGAIPYSTASAFALLAAGSSGQLLQSGGAGAPSWTTATFPASAGLAGTILRSDGTNWVASTATFANTYAVSTILYASSSNAVSGLAAAQNGVLVSGNTNIPVMLAGPGATGRVLQSNAAAAPSWSTSTFPSTGGAAGNVLISDGTNYIASTSLWPNTVGSAGTILRSNGTSNAYSTSTFADTYAASTILYSNGANTVTGLATANNGVLVTNGSGVPSISTTLPTGLAMQTPASLTLTNATGLPISGTTGYGTGVATALASATNISGGIAVITSGTWTPTDASGASLTFSTAVGEYLRIGNLVIATGQVNYPATADGSNAVIGGLPVNVGAGLGARGGNPVYTSVATVKFAVPNNSAATFGLYAAAGTAITNATMTGAQLNFQIIYFTS